MIQIRNRFNESLICEESLDNIKQLVEKNKAKLESANLWGANLWGANLRDADLKSAYLKGANLRYADLRGANLRDANLWDADLESADLRGAYLWGADLWGADLRGADLRGADLESANLWGANLRGAYLWGADETKKEIVSFKSITGVGEFERELQCFLLKDSSFYFNAGCFSGYEDELIKEVKKKYGNNCEYIEAIEFLKNLCKKYNN